MDNYNYHNQQGLNNFQSSAQINAKQENLNQGFQFDPFINYDLSSKFLMKVYGILLFEFLFIFALVLIFQIESVKKYIRDTPAFFYVISGTSLFMIIIILLIFGCCANVLRNYPCNYYCLVLVTIGFGILCAFTSCFYD